MTPSTRMSSNGGPFSRPVRPSDQRSRPPSSLPLHRGGPLRLPLVDPAFGEAESFASADFSSSRVSLSKSAASVCPIASAQATRVPYAAIS